MIRRLVLDVLKPHSPSILELSEKLSKIDGVDGVTIINYEIDREVENVKVVLGGINIKFENVKKVLEECGAAIHSIDQVAAGKKIFEDIKTPQDVSARMR